MQDAPYDTFFDEGSLSKAKPDITAEVEEMHESTRILQKFLDTKKTRQAPGELNKELFKFSSFKQD